MRRVLWGSEDGALRSVGARVQHSAAWRSSMRMDRRRGQAAAVCGRQPDACRRSLRCRRPLHGAARTHAGSVDRIEEEAVRADVVDSLSLLERAGRLTGALLTALQLAAAQWAPGVAVGGDAFKLTAEDLATRIAPELERAQLRKLRIFLLQVRPAHCTQEHAKRFSSHGEPRNRLRTAGCPICVPVPDGLHTASLSGAPQVLAAFSTDLEPVRRELSFSGQAQHFAPVAVNTSGGKIAVELSTGYYEQVCRAPACEPAPLMRPCA